MPLPSMFDGSGQALPDLVKPVELDESPFVALLTAISESGPSHSSARLHARLAEKVPAIDERPAMKILGAVLGIIMMMQAWSATASLLTMTANDFLKRTAYQRLERETNGRKTSDGFDAATGAEGRNVAWERKKPDAVPYIELQRHGAEVIQAGIALNDDNMIREGMKGLAFGFDNMMDASGKPNSGDPAHSFGVFAEGAARAMLLLRLANHDSQFENKYLPKLTLGVEWFLSPAAQKIMRGSTKLLTHRAWYSAALLAEMGALTGDAKYAKLGDDLAVQALSQFRDGINPEKNGFDVNYQMAGILFAERYYVLTQNADLRDKTKAMIRRALETEARHILPDGTIDASGSTREGHELTRNGKVKTPDIKTFLETLAIASDIMQDPGYIALAQRIIDSPDGRTFAPR
jgi:hypothetical protein